MAKFLCVTQVDRSLVFQAPTRAYVSYLGMPFEVDNAEDIAFFEKNKRFRKPGIFENTKPKPTEDVDKQLEKELAKIKGLSKATIGKIVEKYLTLKNLKDAIDAGYKLDPNIPDAQEKMLLKHFE